ncbi:MAG: hypothetical protein WBQ78_17730, partial [Gammaproteobacteria bacterium]
PLDQGLTRILKRYPYAGFKETFRSEVYGKYAENLPNVRLLTAYRDAGYTLIPMVRDPRQVWNSFQRHNSGKGTWVSNLEDFIQCYMDFLYFIGDTEPIVYERFVADPDAEWNIKVGLDLGKLTGIVPRAARMGDADANKSTDISAVDRPICYSDAQKDTIEKSEIMATYHDLLKRGRTILCGPG